MLPRFRVHPRRAGSGTPVQLSLAPVINVHGSENSKETAQEIRKILLGMTDDIAERMSEGMQEAFSNMPR